MHTKFHISSLWRKGCHALSKFKRFHLTTQHRAADALHLQFISDVIDPQKEINLSDLTDNYQPLSQQDILDDPEWAFAPYLVASNRERCEIIHIQAINFALKNQTHVIRWPMKKGQWVGKPADPDFQNDALQDPMCYQYFVKGAQAFCSHNINPEIQLANGSPIVLHSIVPSSEQQRCYLSQAEKMPFGTIITLEEPPLIVNVAIPKREVASPILQDLLDSLQKTMSCCAVSHTENGDPVIPIFPGESPESCKYSKKIALKRSECLLNGKLGLYEASKITLSNIFPYDLAFAMTVHKAQGRTLSKVILCLFQRPSHINQFSINAIYVALSRVKFRSDIRILSHTHHLNPLHYSYLTTISRNTTIPSFLHGFHNLNSWNGERAFQHFQQNN